MSRRTDRTALALAAALAMAACLTACAPEAVPQPTASVSTSAGPVASETPTAEPPVLIADGTADDNRAVFEAALQRVWNADARMSSDAYVEALASAGFAKADMQITEDRTSIGEPADSIQVAVRWAGECLVGHLAPSQPAPVVEVMPIVAGETCLIGHTKPIDG